VERAAYLIAFICSRAKAVGLNGKKPVEIPITQLHIADTLGLSLVHTNKTLKRLGGQGLISWREGGCEVNDLERLLNIARWEGFKELKRPLI
jgi:CRP-like cAMP-binding protein